MKRILPAFASVMLMATAVQAQDKVLTVAGYGGSFETLMNAAIMPQFEAEHGVKNEFVAGNSTDTLARLQAQQGNQEIDVAIMDDGPMYQADALGFCAPITNVPNQNDIFDIAKISGNSTGLGFIATGFAFNSRWFAEQGWEPPSSWKDLEDPKYKDVLALSPISGTYGLHGLVMTARVNGGGEDNIDPGFEVMAEKIAPNVLVFEPSSGRISELFQSESIALTVWGSGRTKSLADTGFPVLFSYPEDGAVALMIAGCPVVDSDVPEEAQAFIDYLLDPEIQVRLADAMGVGPVNENSELLAELAEGLPYGPERVGQLVTVDWDQNREEWTQRWAREVER